MKTRLLTVLGLLSFGCQAGEALDRDPVASGLTIEHASEAAIVATYGSGEHGLRLEAFQSGDLVTSRITSGDRLISSLDLPVDDRGPAVVPYIAAAAAEAGPTLDDPVVAVYGDMIDALAAATAGLGEAPVRIALLYHQGVVGHHQWAPLVAPTAEPCAADAGAFWHTPWMHLRTAELEQQVEAIVDNLSTKAALDCGWNSFCYFHDMACCTCGSWFCGSECQAGCGDGDCLGRCGGGCGDCEPW